MKQIAVLLVLASLAYAAPRGENTDLSEFNGTISYHPTIGGRIVGGVVATINELPWNVAILRNGAQICGGVLVAGNVVLTAAHCIVTSVIPLLSQLNIRAGSALHNSGGSRIAASSRIIHGSYQDCSTCSLDFDIAVIRLASSALVSGSPAAVVPLWEATTVFPTGVVGTVSGWGATSEGGSGSVQLRRVDVPVIALANCRQVYGSVISERTVCAGFAAGGRDACQGDSGGPYVIQGRLAGLVSFGAGCARPGFPGVYASIPGYRAWIRTNAGV